MSEVETGTDTIEGIDLDVPVPCSHSQHDTCHKVEDAAFIVEFSHSCGLTRRYPLCLSGFHHMLTVHCAPWIGGCDTHDIVRDEVITIVEVLR